MTPEGKVKARISAALKTAGAYYFMPVQNGMGAPSLDYIGCINGKFFAIEAKAGDKQMTLRQARTAETMRGADAAVFLVNDVGGLDEVVAWIDAAKSGLLEERPPATTDLDVYGW